MHLSRIELFPNLGIATEHEIGTDPNAMIIENLRTGSNGLLHTPAGAHDWLYSRKTAMAPKVSSAVLRVGRVHEVFEQVANIAADGLA